MIVFSRIDASKHKTLEEQVQEWEKDNKVTECKIGETSGFQTINARADSIKKGGQNGANTTKLTAKLKRDEKC